MKRYFIQVIFIAIISCSLSTLVWAKRTKSYTGTDLYGKHIRALSMGNAFTAVAKTGETALLYNPAGLASAYPDKWNVAFGLNGNLAFEDGAQNLVNDIIDLQGKTDPKKIVDFHQEYKNEEYHMRTTGSGHLFYQQQQPFDSFSRINRLGVGVQRYSNLETIAGFPTLRTDSIDDIDTKSANEIKDELLSIVNLEQPLTSEQDAQLLKEIEKLKQEIVDDPSKLKDVEDVLDGVLQQGFDAKITWIEMTNTGFAVSSLEQRLKIGLSVKNYNLRTGSLTNYELTEAVAKEFDLKEEIQEKRGSVSGFDIGGIYTFENFIPTWRPQIGLVWQNIGGADFGDKTNTEIVDSINLGVSTTKELGPALFVIAADITDITGNYYQLNTKGNKVGRSFSQRFHLGAEVGLWEAAAMENRYIYFRAGTNQGQATYGLEFSLPWNLLRVGYGHYGVDLGNEENSEIIQNTVIYASIGGVL